jgi:dCTP deaminase
MDERTIVVILGTEQINDALRSGLILCDPAPRRVEGAHIDVTLGRHAWIINPHGELDLRTADPTRRFIPVTVESNGELVLPAQAMMLAHTEEFIGTAPGSRLVPVLHTRSTFARWGLSVHQSAGWGDEGYASRWTLEIVNPHPFAVVLPVGGRVGCIVFMRQEGLAADYAPDTRYNHTRATWSPASMLPRRGNW